MANKNDNDKILNDFFGRNKSEIQDNGFSDCVLNQLPRKKVRKAKWIVPVFTSIGVLISVLLIDFNKVVTELYFFILQVPLLYYFGAIMTAPIVVLLLFFFTEKQSNLQ